MSAEVIAIHHVAQRKPLPVSRMPPTRNLRNTQTPDTLALSAAVFGFAGHSLATPHAAISRVWWTKDRISRTVTPLYISSRLSLSAKPRLQKLPAFAKHSSKGCLDDVCLTDDTNLEWISTRCRRVFLALQDCGAADEIFAVVDAAWCDEDLPLAEEDVKFLAGVCSKSGGQVVSSRFFAAQFEYLLRELGPGLDIDYGINEAIPIEYTGLAPASAALEPWFRVHLARRPDKVFVQRKTKFLDSTTREADLVAWRAHVAVQRQASHMHIASVFASYTVENGTHAVMVMDFVPEHTLRSFIEHRVPLSIVQLSQEARMKTMLRWMYCLADAVAYMHRNDLQSPYITPSNILIDGDNRIAFAEVGKSDSFQRAKTLTAVEIYCYEAPEKQPQLTDSIPSRTASRSTRQNPGGRSSDKAPRRYRSFGDLRAARREAAASAAGDLATESDIPSLPAMPTLDIFVKDHRRLPSIQSSRLSVDWIKQISYADIMTIAPMQPDGLIIGAAPPTPPLEKDMPEVVPSIPMPSRPAPRPPKLSIWPTIRPSTPCASQMPATPITPSLRRVPSTIMRSPSTPARNIHTPAPPSPLMMRFFTGDAAPVQYRFPPSPPHTASTAEKPLPSLPTTPASLQNPQHASDIFSLGCVYLDMLSHLLGHRPYTEFVKFRSRREVPTQLLVSSSSLYSSTSDIRPATSSSISSTIRTQKYSRPQSIDHSFHANLPLVTSWIILLEDEIALKKSPSHLKQKNSAVGKTNGSSRGAATERDPLLVLIPLLDIVRSMLSADELARPDAEVLLMRVRAVGGVVNGVGLERCCAE